MKVSSFAILLSITFGQAAQADQTNGITVEFDFVGVIAVDTASFDLLSYDKEILAKQLIEQAFGDNRSILREASPFYNIYMGRVYPEFLILNSTDRPAAFRDGKAFTDKLITAGHEAHFTPVKDHTHKEMAQGMYDASDPVGKAILQFIFISADSDSDPDSDGL